MAVDDGLLDLAADPAVGPERHTAPEAGAEEPRMGADVTGALDVGEGLDDRSGGDRDRTVAGVQHGIGVDAGRFVDRQATFLRPDQAGRLQAMTCRADTIGGLEKVAAQLVGVLRDEIPGPADPITSDLSSSGL